ncbi:MAG: 3'-5' exonuclease [Pseudomonadota bacterium]|nr:3'-5' exonuclease [Pseudomonadota bacterium]
MQKINDLIQTLNEAQYKAATANPGHQLIIAGAGSGKTLTLVCRIAWIHSAFDCPLSRILAVTFTNKAANTIKNRIQDALNIPMYSAWIGTFHSICHKLLRQYHYEFKINQHFQIIDQEDQLRLIKKIQQELKIDEKITPARKTQYFINQQKENALRASNTKQEHHYNLDMQLVYERYETLCRQSDLFDFNELILKVTETLSQQPELAKQFQNQFQYILIDEFQDTNCLQYTLIKQLAGEQTSISVVGDDDQSIYSWRGAKVDHILSFENDFPNVTTTRLEQNYRSTKHILEAANSLIANNSNRLGKTLWTDSEKGELITIFNAVNEQEEARYLVDNILNNQQNDISLTSQAILYRSNAQSRVIEEHLTRAGISYVVYGGLRFFERAEIKDSLAYLRLIVNPNDNQAFERIVNVPARQIGQASIEKLRQIARTNQISLWQSIILSDQEKNLLPTRTLQALKMFAEQIDTLREKMTHTSASELAEICLQTTGLIQLQEKQPPETAKTKLENMQELINAICQYEKDNNDLSPSLLLAKFISETTLDTHKDDKSESNDNVQLMTLHSAKGLEFHTVFLTGMEEGLFPHKRSITEQRELEEERRLCYVGLTRAKVKLHITHAEYRRLYNQENYQRPSRFLNEIPTEHCTRTANQMAQSASYSTQPYESFIPEQHDHTPWRLGAHVNHAKFGFGVVLNFEGQGKTGRVQVKFQNHGVKWLLIDYANLETC